MNARTTAAGLIAGAAGTTALNTITYLDMMLRGRPASTVPDAAIEKLGALFGNGGGDGAARESRRTAAGALGGILTGVVLGTVAAHVRAAGFRPATARGSVLTGLAAMAAADVPVAVLGISDPREWSAADWMSDVVPHLAYGAAVQRTLELLDPSPAGG
ncbi:hypothetical protein [Rhodococcus sp. SGAir0479]|uniref:hypothetical protein n=1 Tax=Rhodococcus sp. SGAir0479 TaxID=2567884 RepID=UPI0010CD6AEB|nr:hypothetical protein [Rhodococcus sp. SGAir0479]QCQ90334.1 hypothetical protein E7742_03280 [Rhodococcus sp. SGAir0479]